MGLLRRSGRREMADPGAPQAAPARPMLSSNPATSDEYQQRVRAQMEQELEQQRARLQAREG